MARLRRTLYAFLYVKDTELVDVGQLMRGVLQVSAGRSELAAFVALTGEVHTLGPEQLDVLLTLPATRWVEDHGRHPDDVVRDLADKGLILTDENEPSRAALRRRDEALSANEWNLYAALFHYMTSWRGNDLSRGGQVELEDSPAARAEARNFAARHGPPPGPFADRHGAHSVALPEGTRAGALYRALAARRTTRAFDQDEPMTAEELATVLRYVYGCHGYARNSFDIVVLKRTSPSGGAMHPIEAYPIVSNVAGVEPGIYHYDGESNCLRLIERLDGPQARSLATEFMCGQSYFGAAHVSIVLTARFFRSHWKYRNHPKAYPAILMDAGHLSQTLYLVAADLRLGAFVTGFINGGDIEDRLGLDGVSEGAIAISGCGRRAPEGSSIELRFSPEPPTD
jgi:putative peptide maturation dehydrogenase